MTIAGSPERVWVPPLAAIAIQLLDLSGKVLNPISYFTYFTIQSNLRPSLRRAARDPARLRRQGSS